jgi:uncharacterized protein
MRRASGLETKLERIETPDGDFLDLYHLSGKPGAPTLVLLHGLEGSLRSHYIQGLLSEASRRSWHAVVLIFRSCGDSMNRTRRFYHSGETSDISFAINHLLDRRPDTRIALTGVSLGGNVLLKYLGERRENVPTQVAAAAAVSVPYDLGKAADHIDKGFARVYQRSFIKSLQSKAIAKLEHFPDLIDRDRISTIRTMRDFDNCLTAPIHGFDNADDYYRKSSALGWLDGIRVETLLLSAVDDPFLPSSVLEQVRAAARNNPALEIEFTRNGGHVGFVGGTSPLRPDYYMERRVTDFLATHLMKPRQATTIGERP